MMKYSISFLLLLLSFCSCKHEPIYNPDIELIGDADWPCYFATDFGCKGIRADQYLTCTLDGHDFCISAAGRDTSFRAPEWQGILGTVIGYQYEFGVSDKDMIFLDRKQPDDGVSESKPHFSIKYSTKQKPGWQYVLDEVIQEGDSLPLSKNKPGYGPDSEGFLISVATSCDVSSSFGTRGASFIDFSSDGPQFPGAFLHCTEKTMEEQARHNEYSFVFEFACNLYLDNRGTKFWRKLEHGKLKVKYRMPK